MCLKGTFYPNFQVKNKQNRLKKRTLRAKIIKLIEENMNFRCCKLFEFQ